MISDSRKRGGRPFRIGGNHFRVRSSGSILKLSIIAVVAFGVVAGLFISQILNTSTVVAAKTPFTRISTGDSHTCAIADGKAYCWGSNGNGRTGLGTTSGNQTTPAAVDTSGALSGKTVTAVSAGNAHTCVVADGKAYCWGNNSNGRLGDGTAIDKSVPTAVDTSGALSGKTVTAVSAGNAHTCAVADGKAYCWGDNSNGRTGLGSTSGNKTTPSAVDASGVLSGKTVTAISAGTAHTCAVADGKAYCWGLKTDGRLGEGSTSGNQTTPAAVDASGVLSGKTVTAISAGAAHTCAVADGKAYCWGLKTNGRLGEGSTSGNQATPVAVDASGVLSGKTVTSISAGDLQTCAIADGKVYCWGGNSNGQLGDASTTDRSTPVLVSDSALPDVVITELSQMSYRFYENTNSLTPGNPLADINAPAQLTGLNKNFRLRIGVSGGLPVNTQLSTGSSHNCTMASGLVYCWGFNGDGRLGNGTTRNYGTPYSIDISGVLSGKMITQVSAGNLHGCAIADSKAYCWGDNQFGQLGDGSTTNSSVPVAVSTSGVLSGKTITQISAGGGHTCAVASGNVYCWGLNNAGQLGDSSLTNSSTPVAVNTAGVLSGKTVASVDTGNNHTCVVADSKAYCWGYNNKGQLGDNSTTYRTTPVAVYTSFMSPLYNKTVEQISTKLYHTCAVANSTAYCWGDNTNGQLGDGSTTQRNVPVAVSTSGVLSGKTVTNMSTGSSHTCAVADGTAYCWGLNDRGQLGDASTTQRTSPVAVSASGVLSGKTVQSTGGGISHSCALADGQLYCWGSNGSGRLGDDTEVDSNVPVSVIAEHTNGLTGKSVAQISSGVNHTCAVAEDKAYCWGRNVNRQVGDGTNIERTEPTAVSTSGALSGKAIAKIDAGYEATCVVADSKAYCWGYNGYGQLGDGSIVSRSTPVAVDTSGALSGKSVTDISMADYSTCAVADGKAYCWGHNVDGRLGDGSTTQRTSPVAVSTSGVLSGKTVTKISTSFEHACAIADGKAYCWGSNADGAFGDGSTISSTTPVAVSTSGVLSGKTVTDIAAGAGYTCVVADGKAYCWGYNVDGELGDGSTTQRNSPVAVSTGGVLSGKTVTRISSYSDSTCAVADGKAYCWGLGTDGILGNGSSSNQTSPVAVSTSDVLAGRVVSSISAGYDHTCAVADGKTFCWGNNGTSQLGRDSAGSSDVPASVTLYGNFRPSGFDYSGIEVKAEFAKLTVASCRLQSTGFSAITTSSAIAYSTNAGASNNATISTYNRDPFDTSKIIPQVYRSSTGKFSPVANVASGQVATFDLSLKNNGAESEATYCIRLINEDGTQLSRYSAPAAITMAKDELSVGIVDSGGNPVASPSFALSSAEMKGSCQLTTGTLGVSSQKIQVMNTTTNGSWSLSLSATGGPTSKWERVGGGSNYDFNDPSGSPPGCNSGSDGDGIAGQLSVNPSSSTISPAAGCSSTGISKGSSSAFNQGSVDTITLLQAGSSTNTNCYWDLTDVGLSQRIPASQQYGDYGIDMTLTVVAL